MPLDFRNLNTLWSSIIIETLNNLGLTTAIISPGSRSTPLTIAFATHPNIETIPVLDERSAAFFALGIAKKNHRPVALVCTSGTAAANFFPAIIEAKESQTPLLVFTADRPPELRHCHSGQTIDQVKLYGNYPNWQTELAEPSFEEKMLAYLRQTIIYGWEKSIFPSSGPVHFNVPFRDPLPPLIQPEVVAFESQFPQYFFTAVEPTLKSEFVPSSQLINTLQQWHQCPRGIIIAGLAQPEKPEIYCQAIAKLSQALNWPVLAEGLSPLRNYSKLNHSLISSYDIILRNPNLAAKLIPEFAVQIGELPTSKQLRKWLEIVKPQRWIVEKSDGNFDPLHGPTIHLRLSVEQLVENFYLASELDRTYLDWWRKADGKVREAIAQKMTSIKEIIEPKIPWIISQILPPKTPLFIANSMPVRDVEYFWVVNHSEIQPFFNRGANGIDGTLSTALGIAHRQQSSVLLTGDLALLHDTNGFLLRRKFIGHLTIMLINNRGGGIFEMLPVAEFEPPFEEFFATPQEINFADLCLTYGVEYEEIKSWEKLEQKLNPLPASGMRVLELKTDRKADAKWRKEYLEKFAEGL